MASNLTRDEVGRIATLARLDLGAEEEARMVEDLGRILEFAGQISELDTTGVPPDAAFLAVGPFERDDVPATSLSRDEALANAPEVFGGLFTVPRMPGRE